MAHTLITIAMFTVIIIPVIMIGIADAKRHPWKPTNKQPVIKPVVIIKPEPMQWKHYD